MRSCAKLLLKNTIKLSGLVLSSCLVVSLPARADISDSIVTIYTKTQFGSSQGTGFVLGDRGLIVTAYHVIEDARSIAVRDATFKELTGVTVEHIDPQHDLAILRLSAGLRSAGLRPADGSPSSQAEVRVAGSPRGLPKQILFGRLTSNGTISSMRISAVDGKAIFAQDIDVYPVDVTIYGGMSGAPVLTNNDSVIGVFSGSYDEGRGIGWAIPIKYVVDLLAGPVLDIAADNMRAWPALALMSSRWVSLKRSYSKPFSSEQIARLEILEQALRVLRGKWKGVADEKGAVFIVPGKCEMRTHTEVELNFEDLDVDKARINGRWADVYASSANVIPDQEGIRLGLSTIEAQAGNCNTAVFGDASVATRQYKLKATVFLQIDNVAEYSDDNNALAAKSNITDCVGDCDPSIYGRHDPVDAIPLEQISDTKLRWGNVILNKQ